MTTNPIDLRPILDEVVDATTKGYPPCAAALPIAAIGAQRWSVLDGDLPLPLAVIRDSALAHNQRWMRDFTQATGVLLAPHGKTTMAPQIFAAQLDAGAWGMTVANVQQLGVCVRFGVRRVIMANQLLGAAEVRAVIAQQARHPDLEFHFLVDSPAQLAAIEAVAGASAPAGRLQALVELGLSGGRTGVRDHAAALALARAVAASAHLALSGIECYEGLAISGDSAQDASTVGALMRRVQELALDCDREGLFAGPAIILTAGGSAAFDIVARELPMRLSKPVLTILRSGCYVTHDSGNYKRLLEGVQARSGAVWQQRPGLQPALEVWSRVQSCPEPGLAVLTFGKRDASHDIDLPVPIKWHRPAPAPSAGLALGAGPIAAPTGWRIAALNDQHAYLRFEAAADTAKGGPADAAPRVGDLIGCGISHPCTTFDKWRLLYTVDDAYRMTGAIRTFF
jgi:D-serine dehydratase